MKKKLALSFFVTLVIVISAMIVFPSFILGDPAPTTPLQWSGNGHYYRLILEEGNNIPWQDAKNAAQAMSYNGKQGYLVTITSAEEEDFIIENLGLRWYSSYWIGGYQQWESGDSPDEGWCWVTGESWSYTQWNTNEPNDRGDYIENGQEDSLEIGFAGSITWNDSSSEYTRYYIVEFGGFDPVKPRPLTPYDWVLMDLNIDQLVSHYGPTPEGFIKMIYDTILARVPDAEGEEYWTGQLNGNIFSGSQIVEHFIFSDELGKKVDAMTNEEFINFLYEAFLSRNPDADGFESWVSYMDSGASKSDTLKVFLYNEEWFDICRMFNVNGDV